MHKSVRHTAVAAITLFVTVGMFQPANATLLQLVTNFSFSGGAPAGPVALTQGSFTVTFDHSQDATRKAVDSISFTSGGFPVTDVFFNYEHSVEVLPGFFNFRLDLFSDLGFGIEGGGKPVVIGQNDFLIQTASLPSVLDAYANGTSPGTEALNTGFLFYSKPGTSTAYATASGNSIFNTTVSIVDVPTPASAPLMALGLAGLVGIGASHRKRR